MPDQDEFKDFFDSLIVGIMIFLIAICAALLLILIGIGFAAWIMGD